MRESRGRWLVLVASIPFVALAAWSFARLLFIWPRYPSIAAVVLSSAGFGAVLAVLGLAGLWFVVRTVAPRIPRGDDAPPVTSDGRGDSVRVPRRFPRRRGQS